MNAPRWLGLMGRWMHPRFGDLTPDEPSLAPSKARLEALADGVFAISMTLLTIELFIGEVPAAELSATLAGLWPRIVVYVASFIVLGIGWRCHPYIFPVVGRSDYYPPSRPRPCSLMASSSLWSEPSHGRSGSTRPVVIASSART